MGYYDSVKSPKNRAEMQFPADEKILEKKLVFCGKNAEEKQ